MAIQALRQTPAKVKMVMYREEGQSREEDIYDVFEVELMKKAGKGLGLSIVGRKNGSGVYISDVVSHSGQWSQEQHNLFYRSYPPSLM